MGRKFFVVLALSLFSVFASAALPVDFNEQKWNELVEQVQLNGRSSAYPNGVYLSVGHVSPSDETQDHQADYLSTVGFFDDQSNYHVDHLEAVSETWTLDAEKNWHIDQWIFVLSASGDITKTMRREIVRTQTGIVLKLDSLPATAEESAAHWGKLLQEWFARLPLSLW